MTVFALMPTLPGREEMRQKAIDSIHRQSYPNSWDVVLLMDADPDLTLGAKLNKMLDSISNLPADHIILVDDDDLHHPTRVARQIQPLIDNPNLLMTGTSVIVFRDTRNNEVW